MAQPTTSDEKTHIYSKLLAVNDMDPVCQINKIITFNITDTGCWIFQ